MRTHTITAAIAALTAAIVLTGCTPTTPGGASAINEPPRIGADPASWTPIFVNELDNGGTFDIAAGQTGVITSIPDRVDATVTSSDPRAVMALQGSDDTANGGAVLRPGFMGIAVGEATITVTDDAGAVLLEFTVNVQEQA